MNLYARFKHDIDAFGDSRSIPEKQKATPETVPLQIGKLSTSGDIQVGGKDEIWLSSAWKDYLFAINPKNGADYVLTPKAGWLNTNDKADTLGFGGNLVEIHRVVGVYAEVRCFDANGLPPDPEVSSYHSGDPRVQKWTVVQRGGAILNPGKGADIYSLLLSKQDMWIHVSRLEFFPTLPMQVTVSSAAWKGLYVRSQPDVRKGKVVGVVGPWTFSNPVTLLEYAPRGSSVWAKVQMNNGKEGYIAILWYPAASQMKYYTSWRMDTTPPIPPIPVNPRKS